MQFPRMITVCQDLYRHSVADIDAETIKQLDRIALASQVKPGARIAVTAGSRGIAGYPQVLKAVVSYLKSIGTRPFLIPAMGSHGGATAEGQVKLLATLGISEATMGAPIQSSMKVVQIGTTDFGSPVYIDAIAAKADGIVLVNRVKEHTEFMGPNESGLMKMMTIGLAKHAGARVAHSLGYSHFPEIIRQSGQVVLSKAKILCGVALLEDGYQNVAEIRAFLPEQIEAGEQRMLKRTKSHASRIPFKTIDVLIVDNVGKNISGAGMDPNVVGRNGVAMRRANTDIDCRTLVALGLTPESKGSAIGLGMADLTTRRAVDEMDRDVTYANVLTSGTYLFGKIPIVLETDKEAIMTALTVGLYTTPKDVRVVRIKDTLHLDTMQISEGLLETAKANPKLRIEGKLKNMQFNAEGRLI